MRSCIRFAAVALLLAPFAAAAASYDLGDRRLALIDDPVRGEAQGQPGTEKIGEVIASTALSKGWKLLAQTDGRKELSLLVRDQHLIRIEIAYDASEYRIRYLESVNLLYRDLRHGVRAIHRNYNVWLKELTAAIDARLEVPVQTTIGFAPLEQANAVPRLKANGREAYEKFLTRPTPRAFAVAPTGAYGWAARANPQSNLDVVEQAMASCGKHSNECKLYVVDDHVVWTPSSPSPAPSASAAQPADPATAGKSPKAQASAKSRDLPASDRLPTVGTAWKYSFRDHKFALPEQVFTVTVTGVNGWTVRESFERESASSPSPPAAVRTSVSAKELGFGTRRMEQNYLLYELSPYLTASEIEGSLKVGQVPAFPGLRAGWKVKVTAVEAAQTKVPAGQFKTIRVEVTGENSIVGAIWDYNRFRYTTWYAPDVKRYVMLRLQSWNGMGVEAADEVVRLTEYRPH